MAKRVFNFSAGPATLPLPVLEEAQKDMIDWKGKGLSVMEMSHRSKDYESIIKGAESTLIKILNIPDTHKVLFLHGGATLQFAMVPLNLLGENDEADYIVTGEWAKKAYEEAVKVGKKANIAASTENLNFTSLPERKTWKLSDKAAYVHYTSNNTIYGTEFRPLPDFGNKLVVCDMSSDFLSRPVDVSKHGIIYAGAQKNAGPAGVAIVIIRKDLAEKNASKNLPTLLKYKIHVDKESMYNTPPCYSIYICGLVFKWIEALGGLKKMEEINLKKAGLIYDAIDNSKGFYKAYVTSKQDRSLMNINYRLPSTELDDKFIEEAKKAGIIGVKGYRTVGGIRASTYNAMPMEGVQALAKFMSEFCEKNSDRTMENA
ncbi:MAG: phosphoserine transaminase [Candidatus Wallbacteria bacterium]|nr:phosphoserine transaminase [Candidatus Wallbacteria bacterium]